MFKSFSLLVLLIGSLSASASEKFETHFENPVVDDRIELTGCAVDGGLYGIATGEIGNVICWGKVIENPAMTVWVFKGEKRKTLDYFEQIAFKDLGGVGDQSGGEMTSSVTIRTLESDLTKPSKTYQSTLKIFTSWDYSEGSSMLKGKLPDSTVEIDAPIFQLSTIDDDLEQFKGELRP